MFLLTEDAVLKCAHNGTVENGPTQDLVTIAGRRVLVKRDPEGKGIKLCPNVSATIKPCQLTLVVEKGYSDLVTIAGSAACLDTVIGKTDGTPPGVVPYTVRNAGQDLVSEAP